MCNVINGDGWNPHAGLADVAGQVWWWFDGGTLIQMVLQI